MLITFIASSVPDGGEEDDERRAADDIASRAPPPPPPHLPPPELCHDFEMIAADKKRELSRSLHLISSQSLPFQHFFLLFAGAVYGERPLSSYADARLTTNAQARTTER